MTNKDEYIKRLKKSSVSLCVVTISQPTVNDQNLIEMKFELGIPKDLDSITKQDVIENKIWIWTWEAGLEDDFDEDWQVPVKNVDDIREHC